MKILLVAPQSRDTTLGAIGNCCRKALVKIGVDLEVFDFRQSQYLKNSIGSFFKKGIKKIISFSPRRMPFINSIEIEKMNKFLLAVAKEYQLDILFVLMGETISSSLIPWIF